MGRPIVYDPATGGYEGDHAEPALFGTFTIRDAAGRGRLPAGLRAHRRALPALSAGAGRSDLRRRARARSRAAARMLWEARPVAYYAWSGVEMQTNSTQIARAIAQLYALTGSFDAPGGNVLFPAVPTANVAGWELLPAGAARAGARPARSGRWARPAGSLSPRTRSTGASWSSSPTRCMDWSASAPTCSSRTPTRSAGARPWPRSTSTSTPTCS